MVRDGALPDAAGEQAEGHDAGLSAGEPRPRPRRRSRSSRVLGKLGTLQSREALSASWTFDVPGLANGRAQLP